MILAIKIAAERAPVLRLVARCEEEAEERTLVLNIETDEGSEELLRLVWCGQEAHAAYKIRGGNRGRGLNTTADQREGPLAEGDVIALLRERLLSFVEQLPPPEEEAREVTVWEPNPRAISRQVAANPQAPNAKVITLPVEKRQEDEPATARRSAPASRPTLVPTHGCRTGRISRMLRGCIGISPSPAAVPCSLVISRPMRSVCWN